VAVCHLHIEKFAIIATLLFSICIFSGQRVFAETSTKTDTQSSSAVIPFPPPKTAFPDEQPTPQALARCTLLASNAYQVPSAVLIGIMSVEGGHVGQEMKLDSNNGFVLGPMKISSTLIPQLAKQWKVDVDTARTWVKDNGCVNVHVGAWVLKQKIIKTGGLYAGIAAYHTQDNESDPAYADKVIEAMKEKDLIKPTGTANGNIPSNNYIAHKDGEISPYQQRLQNEATGAIEAFQFCVDYHTKNANADSPYVANGSFTLKEWLNIECSGALDAVIRACEIAYGGNANQACHVNILEAEIFQKN
jgi:hypothetical protein